jgi:hypothetical protein
MDIDLWFGLSYANYQVLHRSILQSMPEDWQERFVAMLEELAEAAWDIPQASYRVMAVDESGKFIQDPVPHYNRGRTKLTLRGRQPSSPYAGLSG